MSPTDQTINLQLRHIAATDLPLYAKTSKCSLRHMLAFLVGSALQTTFWATRTNCTIG